MKRQVVFIHGGSAYSDYDAFLEHLRTAVPRNLPGDDIPQKWTNTLRDSLPEYDVFMPSMPNSQNAKYLEWKIWFERHFEFLHDGAIVIGWSQGGYFLAKYLTENKTPFSIEALFLLAAPFKADDFDGEDGGDFAFDTSRVGELEGHAEHICIVHSKDDPIVPFGHAELYAKSLPNAEFMVYEDKNHFLIPEFPELIEKIKSF